VKPAPFTVKVKPDDPAVALVGEMDARAGTTVKVAEFEVTPPVVRVTGNVPAVVIRLAGTVAVTWLAFTTVVAKAVPLKFTTESPPKLLPLTVSVNAAPPAVALVGLMELSAGADPTVKLTELDARPPEVTVTGNVPAVAIRLAGIDAVNWLGFATVVLSAVPLKLSEAPAENPVPFTVSVKAGPPAVALVGERELMAGVTGKAALFEVAPPDASVMDAVPAKVRRLAGTAAVTWLELTTVVVNAVLLKLTTESEPKPAPLTVRVSPG
jgi:hypothetical protein